MNDKCYYQHIWSTLMNSFNFRGKAGRTEYAYYYLFLISFSIMLPVIGILLFGRNDSIDIILGRVSFNPFLLTLCNCIFLLYLWIFFSTISLTFRRCRDIGFITLGLIPCVTFIIVIVLYCITFHLTSVTNGNWDFLFDLTVLSLFLLIIVLIVFPFFLLLKKGKEHISISKSAPLFDGKKKGRYLVYTITTIIFLLSLWVIHTNYQYTDWWIDEYIIVCCALCSYLVTITIFCISCHKKKNKN